MCGGFCTVQVWSAAPTASRSLTLASDSITPRVIRSLIAVTPERANFDT